MLGFLLMGNLQATAAAQQAPSLPDIPPITFDRLNPSARKAVEGAYHDVLAQTRDASVNGRLGMLLHSAQLWGEAEVCYRRANLLDPSSFRWAYFLGLVQADAGKFEEAVKSLQKALELDPEYLPARLRLASFLLASAQWGDAATIYASILKKHPESAMAHYGLGRARGARNDLQGAVESLKRACELFPNYGAAHYALAQTYKRLGRMEEAVEQLGLYDRHKISAPQAADQFWDEISALQADPRQELRQAMELTRQGKFAEAIATHERVLQSNPELIEARVNLILLYAQSGDFAKGEEHFRAARRLDPNQPGIYFHHGLLLLRQDRHAEAEREFRRALELDPAHPAAHTSLGSALAAQNRLAEAAAEFRLALETNPEDTQAHFGLGRLLVNQQNYEEGIAHLKACLNSAPETERPLSLYALGGAYVRLGDIQNGLQYLRQARDEARAQNQSSLLENIEKDLRTLENDAPAQ